MRRRSLVLIALVAGLAIGAGVTLLARPATSAASPTTQRAASFVPGCPPPRKTADGNLRPLFCKIVNPTAVRFYRPLAPRLFALGPNATPAAVIAALHASRKASTPELCSAYQIIAYRWHWRFQSNPFRAATGVPCP